MTDNETERERLARTYAEMSDLEVLEIAVKEETLSGTEKEVLEKELMKRGLNTQVMPETVAEAGTKQTSGPLVVVKRFTTLAAASLAKSVLDSAKIDSILTGEKIMGMVYPNLIGAVKLMVRPEDMDTASELLSLVETPATEGGEETDLAKILRNAARQRSMGDKE